MILWDLFRWHNGNGIFTVRAQNGSTQSGSWSANNFYGLDSRSWHQQGICLCQTVGEMKELQRTQSLGKGPEEIAPLVNRMSLFLSGDCVLILSLFWSYLQLFEWGKIAPKSPLVAGYAASLMMKCCFRKWGKCLWQRRVILSKSTTVSSIFFPVPHDYIWPGD